MIDIAEGFVPRFAAIAQAEPGRILARFRGASISFGEIDRRAASFARGLRARGIGVGERVAVMLRNSPETLAVLYGLAKAGVVWVPVNAELRGPNLRYLLEHSEPRLVIAEEDLVARIDESGAHPLLAGAGMLADWLADAADFDEAPPAGDALFAIMYTSGTTGPPKGVLVTHAMLRLAGEAAARVAMARAGDVFHVWEPLYHIGGAQLLVVPLLVRVVLVLVERFSARRFWHEVQEEGATHIHFLGGILQILLKQPPGCLDRAHGARIAWGGGCPAEVWRPFEERFGVTIRECYGMTETSSFTTCNEGGPVGSVGQPLPWFSVTIEDAERRGVPAGLMGEIVVRTRVHGALTAGYFRNDTATRSALREGALHTGDLGSCDAAGNLYFRGRMSESVRCRGENVSAWEVEHVAAEHPAVEDCAMVGVAAEIGEQDIKLFLKPRDGQSIELSAFSQWLAERLAPYQNPRYLAIVEAFERTPSLRIMKHRLSRKTVGCFDRLARR